MNKIIAIVGMCGSGKSIATEYYEKLGFKKVYFGGVTIEKLKEEKKTIIVLTHELEKILALAERFIVLDKGKIRFDGSPQEGLSQNLEQWSIRNPITQYSSLKDLLWL